MGERVLVNHFYAHPVGHAIEALHYAHGHWRADPSREMSVLLSSRTPTELADWCPWVRATFAVEHPLLEPCADSRDRLAHVPAEWDWVLDDARRTQAWQLELFPGLRDFYAATDQRFSTTIGRALSGQPDAGYAPAPWRLELPDSSRMQAARERSGAPRIAVMPAGSSPAEQYPSSGAWKLVLSALREAFGPGLELLLIGKSGEGDGRTATSLGAAGRAALLAHASRPIDAYDRPLVEQLALVEACDVFCSPHTGFGLAALAVGTPWLTISGGRWWEYFFNGVPFRSILPGPRYSAGCFGQTEAEPLVDDDEGPRIASMTTARVREDLPRIIAAAQELVAAAVPYERAVAEYYAELIQQVDPATIWSIDRVHAAYVPHRVHS